MVTTIMGTTITAMARRSHESPWVMLGAVILACYPCSADLWICNRFEHFLAPVFQQERTSSRRKLRRWEKHEYLLMGVSISVPASDGCGLVALQSPSATARRIAASLGGLYQAVVHKYYVDEIYAAVFVRPLIEGSTTILWHGVDQDVIDATVKYSATAAARFPTQRARCSRAICDPMRVGGRWRRSRHRLHVWMESRINMEASIPSFFRWSRSSRAGGLLILLIPRRDRDIKLSRSLSPSAFVASLHLPVHLHRAWGLQIRNR